MADVMLARVSLAMRFIRPRSRTKRDKGPRMSGPHC